MLKKQLGLAPYQVLGGMHGLINMPEISLRDGNFARTKFVTLVDMVLALHKGTIEEFDISGNKNYHDEFGRWMIMLSRRSPKSVIIKLNSGLRYKIPSCLFSIDDLESLHLKNCIISLPRAFQGFKSLTDLSLNIFSSTDRDIQNLISFCPILTNLSLTSFEGIHCLNIQSPKLKYLYIDGDFEDISLDAPNMEVTLLSLDPKAKSYQSVPVVHDKESYVKQSLGSLSEIKKLGIFGTFMKYLSKGCILTKLPAVFTRLEDIYLTICFCDQRQVFTTCSLLQNAPNLKKLHMWARMPPVNPLPPSVTRSMFILVFKAPNELLKKCRVALQAHGIRIRPAFKNLPCKCKWTIS
ncbi:hypothetical protein VPH35_048103 [Triticum aestivum]